MVQSDSRISLINVAEALVLLFSTRVRRLTALVSLWRCCREWDGEGKFRDYAGPMIEAALKRTAVEA